MGSKQKIDSRVTAPAGPWRGLLGRALLSLALACGAVWLLSQRMAEVDLAALGAAFHRVQPQQWAAALGLTAVSFWAVGQYDVVVHRHFATALPEPMTRRAGICAIAVSQTLGLGLVTGAVLRWRMLPGVGLWAATRLTAAVALSFLAGWAVVTATVLLVLPDAPFKGAAALVATAAGAGAALCILAPGSSAPARRLPNGFTLAALVGLCAVDTLAAAAAFHALLPADLPLPFAALLPAFLLALGAGLALGTPGGMGAFEVSLLALLPTADVPMLLAAILAWRAVYFAVPALVGAGLAIRGPLADRPVGAVRTVYAAQRAEWGLTRQKTLQIEPVAGQSWLVGRSAHLLTAVLDPAGAVGRAAQIAALKGLWRLGRREGRMPLVYKAGARLAAQGRAMGLAVRRTGWEGWIAPASYRLGAPCRAGLRRKLRRAEAAGVIVRLASADTAPWPALDQIAADWARAHGGERGFSMGRYDRGYLAGQRLYVAWAGDRPLAFASFHTCADEWALDLMRHGPGLPDGTMHSLVQAAIDDAARAGLDRLSLAAVPDGAMPGPDLVSRLLAALVPETANRGLLQFKSAFAPRWRPLYLVAPHRAGMVVAAIGLWRAICHPSPSMTEFDGDHEEYEFASAPASWHIARKDT